MHICKNGETVYSTSSCLDILPSLDAWKSLPGDSDQGFWTQTYLDDDVANNMGLSSVLDSSLGAGTYSLDYHNTNDVADTNGTKGLIDNLDVYIYGEGERFTGIEQLTAYFPSSLLFGSPRLGIKIPNCAVPKKAKRLLIYRTLSSHDNNFDPLNYGLVKAIPILRSDGTDVDKVTSAIIPDKQAFTDIKLRDGSWETYHGFYYFDEVKDSDLDFGDIPNNYEGLRQPLKSKFNIPLNERMYYINFEQTYQPLRPRKSEYLPNGSFPGRDTSKEKWIFNTNVKIGDSTDPLVGFDETTYLKYKYIYTDRSGIKSEAQWNGYAGISTDPEIISIINPNNPQVVVLYYIPSGYDYSIETNSDTLERIKRENGQVQIYRSSSSDNNTWTDYFYIGTVGGADQGIFLDDNTAHLHEKLDCTCPLIEHYESGMMWSEPNRPDWIKPANFTEYRAGDGKQATGIQSQYGNLVVFKETSIHREAVQAKDPPISRRDEIDPNVGCVAQNALINVDNILYFLSWKGLMMYDNNQLKKVDGAFDEELQFIIQQAGDAIRDASLGYNPAYNEIYLNIPMPESKYDNDLNLDEGRVYDAGNTPYYKFERSQYGHIYVLNLEKQYATKFSYATTVQDPILDDDANIIYIKESTDTRQFIRKYFTNSLGELRSGDILPSCYGSLQGDTLYNDGVLWAGIYIETPYQEATTADLFKDVDKILNGRYYSDEFRNDQGTIQLIIQDSTVGFQYHSTLFPPVIEAPIRCAFKSKFFTGDDESLVKRVRKGIVQMYSRGEITVKGITIPYESADERIDNLSFPLSWQEFKYNPSISSVQPLTGNLTTPTNRSVLSFVPQTPWGNWIQRDGINIQSYNDYVGKPLRFSIEVESTCRTQINEIAIHWRAINKYLA